MATIMNDGERSLARGGPGAVMGSKNLKAVVVEGKERPGIDDQERFKFILAAIIKANALCNDLGLDTIYVILHQNAAAAIDSLVVCKFANMAVAEEYFARALSAVTGLDFSTGDLIRVGERIWNLERLYNLREGFTAADDTLPSRLLQEPVPDGPSQGWVSNLKPMLAEYYRARPSLCPSAGTRSCPLTTKAPIC
jgi:aldehyde:ferredoxin oxidoreductase